MEILIFNILKVSPISVFDLETRGLFYFVENLVFYKSMIRQQANPQLDQDLWEIKKKSKKII